ncbi:MAG: hypothetical protein WBB22_17945 [Anaerolineae bacterium]
MESNEEIVQIAERLADHEKRISDLEAVLQKKPHVRSKPLSIKEFILQKKPRNDVQKALAIGFYLEQYEDYSSFNVTDLADGFRAAKERVPDNVGDKVQKNIRNGHMMVAKEKKDNLTAWTLTNSGEEYVENDFKKRK